MPFTKKTTKKSPLWACGDKMKILICLLALQKNTHPNQGSITPHANFYRRMLSYNIIKKEAAKWNLIYFFSISLFFLKVIWYNLDNVVLKLHKKVTKNEKSFVFSKKNEENDELLKKWKIWKNAEQPASLTRGYGQKLLK